MDSESVIYYYISQQRLLKRTLRKVCLLHFKTQRPPCEILLRKKLIYSILYTIGCLQWRQPIVLF